MKCLNSFNEFYFKEFNQMVNEARARNSKNLMIIYRKVAFSIQKYPFPILTPAQASCLEGVGENISKIFERLIGLYRGKIKSENVNYIELAYILNNGKDGKKKNAKRKQESDSEAKNNLKSRKKLTNIESYSDAWNAAISCFILSLLNETKSIKMDEALNMSDTVFNQLKGSVGVKKCTKESFAQLKQQDLIDGIENRGNTIKINEFLIRFAKIELKKNKITFDINNGDVKLIKEEEKDEFKPYYSQQVLLEKPNFDIFNSSSSRSSFSGSKSSKKSNTTLDNFIKTTRKVNFAEEIKSQEVVFTKFNINSISSSNNIQETQPVKANDLSKAFKKFKEGTNNFANNIVLLIDNREQGSNGEDFNKEISERTNIECEERNLSVGDFMWIYVDPKTQKEYVLDYIIERKALSDLAKSIIDGRYGEQKYRLKSTGLTNIYYIFEGTSFASYNNISKAGLNTAIYNTLNIHDLNIVKTNSFEDSIKFITSLDSYIKRGNLNIEKLIPYEDFERNYAKTKNSSLGSIFIRQIRCVSLFLFSLMIVVLRVLRLLEKSLILR
jgi:ERCC4-type nuclease